MRIVLSVSHVRSRCSKHRFLSLLSDICCNLTHCLEFLPTLLEKNGSKIVPQLSPKENPFWFLIEPFSVPIRTILLTTKKGSSKGSPMGKAKEPFKVLDSTYFSKSVFLFPYVFVLQYFAKCAKPDMLILMTVYKFNRGPKGGEYHYKLCIYIFVCHSPHWTSKGTCRVVTGFSRGNQRKAGAACLGKREFLYGRY